MTEPIAILILAAGASSRMRGGDKLLETIDGMPQLARVAQAALDTGAGVWIALPPDRPARQAAVSTLPLHRVVVPDAETGMAASIRAGLDAMPPGAVMLLLADLPELTADDLACLISAHHNAPDRIQRATSQDGQPGHPVIFPALMRPALAALAGDTGARDLLRQLSGQTDLVPLPGAHATTDLDTPEAWADWRAARAIPRT